MIIVKKWPNGQFATFDLQDLWKGTEHWVGEIEKWIGPDFDGEIAFWHVRYEQFDIVRAIMAKHWKNAYLGGNSDMPKEVEERVYGGKA